MVWNGMYTTADQFTLWGGMGIYSFALGMTHLCGTHTRSMIRLERMLGCRFTPLGDKKQYWGEVRYPYVLSLEEIAPLVAERWYREMSENQIQSGR
jgi:hypothetical protein